MEAIQIHFTNLFFEDEVKHVSIIFLIVEFINLIIEKVSYILN